MSSALIIIDLIQDIVGEHSASHSQTQARGIIPLANSTAAYARRQNVPVIWIKVGFADDYHDIPANSPMFSGAKRAGRLRLSANGCDWAEGLDVHAQDEIVVKKAVSAFAGNQLQQWLNDRGYDHLLLGGVSSLMAIQSTARQAHDLGFKVSILEDLCAAATQEAHQQSMTALAGMAHITNTTAWVQES
ncbi:cysteine hydrolase family protein [Budvicia diplopodorum]|uniref:cysteine hydrolase family protein n=1 Tax=Budvicia diplopodorum TaxID=1119056 RepID=UPI00135906ED|nr:isochorismatase family cysteine hydrolase [Budvicia diplopodorum]